MLGSSFELATEADGAGGGIAALWGQGSAAGFSGRGDDVAVSGTVTTLMLGADWSHDGSRGEGPKGASKGAGAGGWTAGLLVGRSHGDGEYSGAAGSGSGLGSDSGKVTSTITGLFPYGRYALTDRVTVWGAAGYGAGTLRMTREFEEDGRETSIDNDYRCRSVKELKDKYGLSDEDLADDKFCTIPRTETWRTGMDLMMAAVGLRGTLLQAPAEGGPEIAVTADAFAVRTRSDAAKARENGSRLAAATGDATRMRLGVEASWRGLALGGTSLTPSLELGLRHDGGDAETGFGLDLGGGLAWSDPRNGFRAEVRGRGLLTHDSAGFRNRGIAGTLSWVPGTGTGNDSGRGPRLTFSQTLGNAASGGAAALLNRTTLENIFPAGDGDELSRGRLEIRAGYGFAALGGRFVWTPELGFAMAGEARDYNLGWTLVRRVPGDSGALEFEFEAQRRESGAHAGHSLGLRMTARW